MIKLIPYILFEKYIFILNHWKWLAQEPAACELYRYTFVPYWQTVTSGSLGHQLRYDPVN